MFFSRKLSVIYILEDTSQYGGVKVVFEHASLLRRRGLNAKILSKGRKPLWMDTDVPVITVSDFSRENIPAADIHIATYWTTVLPVVRANRAKKIFHFCQGYEGSISYFQDILPDIEEAYSQPIPKILIAPYLKPILSRKFPGNYYIVPQAIDHSIFFPEPKDSPSRPFRIAIVGHFIVDLKGIREALEALSLLRQQGKDFRVMRASTFPIESEEKELGMTDEFYESLPAGEMGTFYRKADLLIHPSHSEEGFPLPPLEAMACGTPVIHSDIPSFDEVPRSAAIRFPAGNREEIASAGLEVMDSGSKWKELRLEGLKAAAEFNFERAAERLVTILKEYRNA